MTSLFQNYLDHTRQFRSMMDLCANTGGAFSLLALNMMLVHFLILRKE
jgi:hypothetical protein